MINVLLHCAGNHSRPILSFALRTSIIQQKANFVRMLSGKVSLITGGASGLGKETAEMILKEGGKVVIADLPSSKGEDVAKEFNKAYGEGSDTVAVFSPMDVTSEEKVIETLELCKKTFDKLNIVVNCAVYGNTEKTYDIATDKVHSLQAFKRVLEVNTVGTFNVCRLSSQLLAKNAPDGNGERGVIINVSSVGSIQVDSSQVAYGSSKAAVNHMSLIMAKDLADCGIRVVCVSPGAFETPAFVQFRDKHKDFKVPSLFPKRPGKPSEFASLALQIITNPMLNGVNIRIDGGSVL